MFSRSLFGQRQMGDTTRQPSNASYYSDDREDVADSVSDYEDAADYQMSNKERLSPLNRANRQFYHNTRQFDDSVYESDHISKRKNDGMLSYFERKRNRSPSLANFNSKRHQSGPCNELMPNIQRNLPGYPDREHPGFTQLQSRLRVEQTREVYGSPDLPLRKFIVSQENTTSEQQPITSHGEDIQKSLLPTRLGSPYQHFQGRAPSRMKFKVEPEEVKPQKSQSDPYGRSAGIMGQIASQHQIRSGNRTPQMYNDDEFLHMSYKDESASRRGYRYPVIQGTVTSRNGRSTQAVIDLSSPRAAYEQKQIITPTRKSLLTPRTNPKLSSRGSEGSNMEFEEALEIQTEGRYANVGGRHSAKSKTVGESPRQFIASSKLFQSKPYQIMTPYGQVDDEFVDQQPRFSSISHRPFSGSTPWIQSKYPPQVNGIMKDEPCDHNSDDETLEGLIRGATKHKRPKSPPAARKQHSNQELSISHVTFNGRLPGVAKVIDEPRHYLQNGNPIDHHTPRRYPMESPRNSNLLEVRTPSINGDIEKPYFAPKQSNSVDYKASQATKAKERAELRRQQVAEDRIFQQQRRAQELEKFDDLFDEAPFDREVDIHVKKSIEVNLQTNVKDDTKSVLEHQNKAREPQAAEKKELETIEADKNKVAQLRMLKEGDKEKANKKEEERHAAKKHATIERLECECREREIREGELQETHEDDTSSIPGPDPEMTKKIPSAAGPINKALMETNAMVDVLTAGSESELAMEENSPTPLSMPPLLSPIIGMETNSPEKENSEEQVATTGSDVDAVEIVVDFQGPPKAAEQEKLVENTKTTKTQVPANNVDNLALARAENNEDVEAINNDKKKTCVMKGDQKPQVEIINVEEVFPGLTLHEQEPSDFTEISKRQFIATAPHRKPQTTMKNNSSVQKESKNLYEISMADITTGNQRRPLVKPKVPTNVDSEHRAHGYMSKRQKKWPHGRKPQLTALVEATALEEPENSDDPVTIKARLMVAKELGELERLKTEVRTEGELQSNALNLLVKALEVSNGKGSNIIANLNGLCSGHSKRKSLNLKSHITMALDVESRKKQREEAKEASRVKYEQLKQSQKRRYERTVREAMASQGKEIDEEILKKNIEERLAIWEENRRKRGHGDSKSNEGLFSQASDEDGQGSPSPATEGDNTQPEIGKQNPIEANSISHMPRRHINQAFVKAALKSRVEELDSEESEEDPDPEEESAVGMNKRGTVGTNDGLEGVEENLNQDDFEAETVLPLPENPETSHSLLPGVVNPSGSDLMHAYKVRHRAERGDVDFDSVVLGSFHSLSEANTFAQEKLAALELGPSTGKSETHDADNLYIGRAITDKGLEHAEIVWVTRDIIFTGDVANLKPGDLKHIVPSKVFNVVQVLYDEDAELPNGHGHSHNRRSNHRSGPRCTVMATTSIKALANKKAVDLFLALSKPSRPRLEWLDRYEGTVAPMVRQKLETADGNDWLVELTDGFNEETQMTFSVVVCENVVEGPMN